LTDEEALKVEQDALERYWRAVELADGVRAAWEKDGQALTVTWPNGTVSEAPLLKLLREAERDCERFARAIPKPARRPGRKPVATMETTIGKSPAAKLRAV
jgi:hypothetical protein